LRHEESIKMTDNIIPIGEKIIFNILDTNFKGIYSSYIDDLDKTSLYVLMPTDARGIKGVAKKGDRVAISFIDAKKGRLGFFSVVEDIIKDNKKIIYKISRPEKLFRTELRDNFRVDTFIEAIYNIQGTFQKRFKKTTILNLSAGGAKISVDNELQIGDKINLSFHLDGYKMGFLEAEICREAKAEIGLYHYGVKFVDMPNDSKERIIKYCIKKQLEMIRKG